MITIKTRNHGYQWEKHNAVKNPDSGVHWAVFPANTTLNEARAAWMAAGADPDRQHCSHEHDCCACYFQGEIYIARQFGNRTLVFQSWGINI